MVRIDPTAKHWIIFLLVPGINLLLLTIMHVELGLAFGKHPRKTSGSWAPCPGGGLGTASGNDNWVGKRDWSKTRKSTAREWSEALIWATVVAGSLRMLIVEPFTIPTPSMEGSMLVGDYLIVSKMSYGPKLPQTPFTMPFVHNALPGGLTPSYTSWFSLPYISECLGWRDVEALRRRGVQLSPWRHGVRRPQPCRARLLCLAAPGRHSARRW